MTFPDVTTLTDAALKRLIRTTDGSLSLRDYHAALLSELDDREEAREAAA